MKRILVISWFYPPINSSEGLVTYKLLKNSRYEYDICMQTRNASWSYGNQEMLPECKNVHKICAESETMEIWKENVLKYFCEHSDEYDIVMTRSMPPESHEIGLKIKEIKPQIKWIASFGDPIANNPFVLKDMKKYSPYSLKNRYIRHMSMKEIISPKRMLKDMLWNKRTQQSLKSFKEEQKLEDDILQNCDHVIMNNIYQEKYMLKNYNDDIKSKALVLPHSFDVELYGQEAERENENKIRMVYIGHLDDIRTPRLFFKALVALRKQQKDLADRLEVLFYGNMAAKDKVFLMDNELLDIVQVKKPIDYRTSLSIMKSSDWLIHIDANLHGGLNENIFFAAKLADYIGANKPIFGITMLDGAGADILREVNGVVSSYTVDEIKNYLYLIVYENYVIEPNIENANKYNAIEVAKKFDEFVKNIQTK